MDFIFSLSQIAASKLYETEYNIVFWIQLEIILLFSLTFTLHFYIYKLADVLHHLVKADEVWFQWHKMTTSLVQVSKQGALPTMSIISTEFLLAFGITYV